jgi:hypothetical protein
MGGIGSSSLGGIGSPAQSGFPPSGGIGNAQLDRPTLGATAVPNDAPQRVQDTIPHASIATLP